MLYETLKTLHVLSIIVWIGGMVFAHFFLRPAVAQLEVPQRLQLMHDVLGRFFQTVLVASLLTLASGVWMLCGDESAPTASTYWMGEAFLRQTRRASAAILTDCKGERRGMTRKRPFRRCGMVAGADSKSP